MSDSTDPIDAYLDELLSKLRGPAAHIRRTLAEAEAHLRDSVDAELSTGAEPAEAQRRAVERFGSPRRVASAANREISGVTAVQLLGAVVGAVTRMGAIGLAAIALAAVVARGLAAITSTTFVYGIPTGTALAADRCRHWLSVQPGATTCSQAATLENASDTFQLYVGGAFLGLLGIGILVLATVAVRRARRAPRPRMQLPAGVEPAIGATVFGGTGLALLAAGLTDVAFGGFWGQGLWYVEAGIALAVALGYTIVLLRDLLAGPRPLALPA